MRGNVLVFSHKDTHLDDVARLYPADHYVAVDGKAGVLARMRPSGRSASSGAGGNTEGARRVDRNVREDETRMRVTVAVTRERLESGLTYEQYKGAMTRNRERFDASESRVRLDPETLRVFRALRRPLHVLVLAEDWCGDVIANLPVLGVIARETGSLDVRIFYRDQHPDLAARWLNQGKYQSIPVFVFFDEDMRELAHWIERPAAVTELRAAKRREIYAANPEFGAPDAPVDQLAEDVRARLQAEIAQMRDDTTPFANAEVQRELRELVSGVAA